MIHNVQDAFTGELDMANIFDYIPDIVPIELGLKKIIELSKKDNILIIYNDGKDVIELKPVWLKAPEDFVDQLYKKVMTFKKATIEIWDNEMKDLLGDGSTIVNYTNNIILYKINHDTDPLFFKVEISKLK